MRVFGRSGWCFFPGLSARAAFPLDVVAGVFFFAQMYSNYGGENATIFFKYGRGL